MVEALVLINLARRANFQQIVDQIAGLPNVQWARLLFGPMDAAAFVGANDMDTLKATIFQINNVAGVAGTDTRLLAS